MLSAKLKTVFKKVFLILVFLILLFSAQQFLAKPTLILNNRAFLIELANTPEKQARGLSGRTNLAENHGMLFDFTENVIPNFWMKEMHFPLDIIWLDGNKTVVDWEENISPDTFPKTFSPSKPVRYVLEINAGWAEKLNLKIGDKAFF